MRSELSWATCLLFILLAFVSIRTHRSIEALETRIVVLEKVAEATVEIHVERAYDVDMATYGYKMIAVLPEKEKEVPK